MKNLHELTKDLGHLNHNNPACKETWRIDGESVNNYISITTSSGKQVCRVNWHELDFARAKLIMYAPTLERITELLIQHCDDLDVQREATLWLRNLRS